MFTVHSISCPYAIQPHVDIVCDCCRWFAVALATPKRKHPPLRGIADPIRSLTQAARTVAITRRMEAAQRTRAAADNYRNNVARWQEQLPWIWANI